ncbi:MAG: sensor histidine kinase [Clostridiales bacterium]|nr:sensor histidine kinase [Clostridiales bacterium]
MIFSKKSAHSKTSIRKQIMRILITFSVVILAVIMVLVGMMLNTSGQYTAVLQNAKTAADFNKEFKITLDSEMYNHVIRPRSEVTVDDLPMTELDNAVDVLTRLEKTTTLADNKWRIRSMLNMLENLRGYMIEIAGTERYDDRMELLERNIRGETGLTRLIETYMHEYLDDEVREMVRLEGTIRQRTVLTIVIAAVSFILVFIGIIIYSVSVSRKITGPIRALSEKAARFGEGDFTKVPVDTASRELLMLDKGFDEMAERITTLMEKQIDDERTLHKTELELLQAQINPHFLYNTLDSIAILAESGREEDAVLMVNSLSSFFRISLSKGKDIIPLESEVNHVNSYLQIQQIRYSDILKYDVQIPEEIKQYYVPKLILQPLVENALYHGIKNRRGIGTIRIEGKDEGGDILLTVSDNGAGMDEEQINALQAGVYHDRHTGLGLVNVHKRIRLYCGEKYGLLFASEKGKGTSVSIRLPKTLRPESQEGSK